MGEHAKLSARTIEKEKLLRRLTTFFSAQNEERLEDEAEWALPGPLDVSFPLGKCPGEGHYPLTFLETR